MTGEERIADVAGADRGLHAGSAAMLVRLHHAGEVGADPHTGKHRAAVVVVWTHERVAILYRRLGPSRIDHGPQIAIADETAGAKDHGLAGPDVDGLGTLVDVAVLPEAFETLVGRRIEARRIARLDTEHAPRERLLADQLVHMAAEHEADALLAGAVFH